MTNTAAAKAAQREAFDRILANHKLYCTACDNNNGNCTIHNTTKLRRYMMRLPAIVCFTRLSIVALVSVVLAVVAGRVTGSPLLLNADDDAELLQQARGVFKPLPKDMATAEFPITPARVRLGRMLFFEPRISADGTGSCLRCHQPAFYGADALPKSIGIQNKHLPRNAPTVFNAALYTTQHWDGVFANVEDQAKHALLGPGFGNPDYATAVARVKAIPGYASLFQQAFPGEAEPITENNWGKAIGAFERHACLAIAVRRLPGGQVRRTFGG